MNTHVQAGFESLYSTYITELKLQGKSAVKIARNAIQFCYKHVFHHPWTWVDIIKPPKTQVVQDVLSPTEVARIINATRKIRLSG